MKKLLLLTIMSGFLSGCTTYEYIKWVNEQHPSGKTNPQFTDGDGTYERDIKTGQWHKVIPAEQPSKPLPLNTPTK